MFFTIDTLYLTVIIVADREFDSLGGLSSSLAFKRLCSVGFISIFLFLKLVSSSYRAQFSRHLSVGEVSECNDVYLIVKVRREGGEKRCNLKAVGCDEILHEVWKVHIVCLFPGSVTVLKPCQVGFKRGEVIGEFGAVF